MLWEEGEDVPGGIGPLPQQEEFWSGQPTLEEVYPVLCEVIISRFDRQQKSMDSCFDRWDRKMNEILDGRRVIEQHVTSLEQDARQPRLVMEADGQANKKTRKRTEGATTALQAMHGDSCTAQNVQDGPKTSYSFGVKAEPPALPCRDAILVEDGATAPTSCLSSLEMRSPSAAGGSLPAGKTSTATETTSKEPLLRFYATEETNPKEKK